MLLHPLGVELRHAQRVDLDREYRRGAGRARHRRHLLHRRAVAATGRVRDEPAPAWVLRPHRRAQFPSARVFHRLQEHRRHAGRLSRSAGGASAAAPRERAVARVRPGQARRRLPPGPSDRLFRPPPRHRRGQRRHPARQAWLAGGAAGDVPAQDQPVQDPRRLGHLRRPADPAAADSQRALRAGGKHPEHPFEGPGVSLTAEGERRRVRSRQAEPGR